MEQDDFKQNIEELFRLFKKLVDKYPEGEQYGINKFQFEQLKLFLQNYEMMKDQLTLEMMGQLNEPMKQMLSMFLKQLREELGEEAVEILPENEPIILENTSEINDIERIDKLLANPDLSPEQIDKLLDERSRLKDKLA
ncbi:MAG: hypothetical protein KGZ82_02550 [Bacteroidales bacterium]|nr:hypothetical protein [Bacteroidales bacterium]